MFNCKVNVWLDYYPTSFAVVSRRLNQSRLHIQNIGEICIHIQLPYVTKRTFLELISPTYCLIKHYFIYSQVLQYLIRAILYER